MCCCVLEGWGGLLDPGSNPGRRSFVLQVLKTECYDEFESQSGSEALGIVVSIAAFKAVNPGSIPGRRSSVLQVLKTESYHESRSCY